ncbi:MAG TPA: hypothetical protein VHU85_08915 [Acidimicrobiales bacterium]|jgi:hypothetical protein|nr:hypothetical protein [Acidimicrobiales bacterium]
MAEPSPVPSTHRVIRIHGGRLVNAEPRADLESELDKASAEGFGVVSTFAVDDNVYLVLAKPVDQPAGS